jgi:hypothetical protein
MRRSPKELPGGTLLLKLLNGYSLAAAAAGMGVMACAPPVYAAVVYTPVNVSLFVGGPMYDLDLNGDGVTDFELRDLRLFGSAAFLYIKSNSVMISLGQFPYALAAGARIGSSRRFAPGNFPNGRVVEDVNQSSSVGYWGNVANHYVGLKFKINGQTHYGWMRMNLEVKVQKPPFLRVRVTGYAYETVPNQRIVAGQTKSAGSDGSLGSLARGSAK